ALCGSVLLRPRETREPPSEVRRNAVNRDTPSLPPRRRLVLSSLQALLLPLERLSQNPSEQGFPLPLAGVGGGGEHGRIESPTPALPRWSGGGSPSCRAFRLACGSVLPTRSSLRGGWCGSGSARRRRAPSRA